MILASTSLIFDPVWPWSLPLLGWPALVAIVLLIAGLTALTYLVGQRASLRQFLALLALRVSALLLVLLLLLRPALAQREESVTPSRLLILVDGSASMNNKDEFNSQSRWEAAQRLLHSSSVKQALQRLQEDQKVEVLFYQGAETVSTYVIEGSADGKRTDIGQWLQTVLDRHGNDPNVRALVILSDGADNGTTHPALDRAVTLARQFPIHAFGLGSTKTSAEDKDIYFVQDSISVTPSPAAVKGQLTVKATLNAPGFVGARPNVKLFIGGEPVAEKSFTLELREGNKIEMTTDAPAKPGDYEVKLRAEPLKFEVSELNNEIGTYVTVTKDGISVLWVEGKKRLESTWAIRHVLSQDPKVRVFYTERLREKQPASTAQKDWFKFDQQHYDVVVIGDISASRFSGGDPEVFTQLEKLIARGSGLLLLGGYESFANSDWHKKEFEVFTKMLPVRLNQPGQVEGAESVRVLPTTEGLDHYLLRIAEDPKENEQIWKNVFRPLDGMTKIGTVLDEAALLATSGGDKGRPVMAFKNYGGRVLVFGGDTTYKAWRKSDKAVAAYERFWKRTIYWLAQKEKVGEDVWVKLATRRLPAGGHNKIAITVGLHPEKSKKYTGVHFKVRVTGPDGKESLVTTVPKTRSEVFEQLGHFWETNTPGEYVVKVDAHDSTGKKINDAPAEAHFLAYAQDLESLRPAADHAFLSRLAGAGGGQFHVANESELADLLNQLAARTNLANQAYENVWPDWNRAPVTGAVSDQVSALVSSGLFFVFVVFCSLLCLEWFLRRQWNMV